MSRNPNRCTMSHEFCERNGCANMQSPDDRRGCFLDRAGLTPPEPQLQPRTAYDAYLAESEANAIRPGEQFDVPLHHKPWDALGFGRDERRPTLHDEAVKLASEMLNEVGPGDWLASLTSAERKECAASRGFAAYFRDAIALVARHSVRMNEKHNPGQPVHWARGKSADQRDCELRHLLAVAIDEDARDADGAYEMICKAWRAFADLQEWAERKFKRDGRID